MEALRLLKPEECVGVIIDVQEKLARVVDGANHWIRNVAILARGLRELGVPVVVTEQYPRGIGPTVAEVLEATADSPRIEKREFGCFANGAFQEAVKPFANKAFILCGFETHVCVLQTALQARAEGHRVFVMSDAVGSRDPENKRAALERLALSGCVVTTVETTLFELLGTSEAPAFKTIQALIK